MTATYGPARADKCLPQGSMEVAMEAEAGDIILLPAPPTLIALEASVGFK